MNLLQRIPALLVVLLVSVSQAFSGNGKPLKFIENQGQWNDNALFRSDVESGAVFLESDGFMFVQMSANDLEAQHMESHELGYKREDFVIRNHAWKVRFIGASSASVATGDRVLTGSYNYLLGNDQSKWASNVKAYEKVNYTNLYDGINAAVYGHKGHFKYDLIVQPGVSTDHISFFYDGVDGVELSEGHLWLQTSVGEYKELAPYAYQIIDGKQLEVPCHYKLENGIVSFDFPKGYDTSIELVIDPTLEASTLSGTSGSQNYGHCATYDDNGNIYTGAISFGAGYPTTTGAFQTTFSNGIDIAVSKLSPDGSTLIYATYLGGNQSEYPHSMILDPNGELYLMGTSASNDYPVSTGAFDNALGGTQDIVVTHLNQDGTALIGSSFVGGSDADGQNQLSTNYGDSFRGEIIIDGTGNCFVTACTNSTDFPVTAGVTQGTYGGGTQDAVVFSMPSDLSAMNWSTYLGGTGHEVGFGLRLIGADVYVCGATDNAFFTATGYQTTYGGGTSDGYVLRLNGNGATIDAGTYWGLADQDNTFFMDLDPNNDVYIYGQSMGGNSPVSAGVYENAGSSQYITAFDPTLANVQFSTVIGSGSGTQFDFVPIAFMVDDCRYIYFSGHSNNGTLPTSPGALQTTGGFYIGVLDPGAAALNYATHFGGPGDHVDGGTSRFDPVSGTVYQAVCTSNGFNTTANAYSGTYPGGYDIGVFKISLEPSAVSVSLQQQDVFACDGLPHTVDFTGSSYPSVQHFWSFGDGNTSNDQDPSHPYNSYGTFDVQYYIVDTNNCVNGDTATAQITIVQPEEFTFSFDFDPPGCLGNENAVFNFTGSGAHEISWDMGDGTILNNTWNIDHTYTTPGTYTVVIQADDTICNRSETHQEVVTFSGAEGIGKPYMPNVFTPNGDNVNEMYHIVSDGFTPDELFTELEFYSIQILNRWGNLVFENDPSDKTTWGWNGHAKDTPVKAGNYFYKVTYIDPCKAENIELHGFLRVAR